MILYDFFVFFSAYSQYLFVFLHLCKKVTHYRKEDKLNKYD